MLQNWKNILTSSVSVHSSVSQIITSHNCTQAQVWWTFSWCLENWARVTEDNWWTLGLNLLEIGVVPAVVHLWESREGCCLLEEWGGRCKRFENQKEKGGNGETIKYYRKSITGNWHYRKVSCFWPYIALSEMPESMTLINDVRYWR